MRRGPVLALLFSLVLAGLLILFTPLGKPVLEIFMAQPTPQADRLFKPFDATAWHLAQRIERGEAMEKQDFAPLTGRLDQRYGEDITLLFQALSTGNVEATIALMQAGADLRQTDKATGSSRDFIYFLSMPGGPLIEQEGMNRLIQAYLAIGGDPNVRLQGDSRTPLIAAMGLGGMNMEGVHLLLDAGADPWAGDPGDPDSNLMNGVNLHEDQFGFYDEMIDRGYFDNLPQDRLQAFLISLGGYAQRGDAISLEIQRIAKRVLKRNPDFVDPIPSSDGGVGRIFKKHWQDPAPGLIPWDEIRSDAVQ